VIAISESRVAKGKTKGRPTASEGPANTRLIRAFEDIADMLAWIVRIEGGTTANLIDPMLRPQVTARFERHRETVDRIKKAEDEVRRVEDEEATKRDAPPEEPQPKKKPKKPG
jgi:hypothetical protein